MRSTRFWIAALPALLGCAGRPAASTAAELAPGRGLFAQRSVEWIATHGYPDEQQRYRRPDWGQLYDENGVPYGPGTFVKGNTPVESHPQLTRSDEFVESPWVRVRRTRCCAEDLQHHLLEIFDLHWHDMRRLLQYAPQMKIEVYSPATIEDWNRESGLSFEFTQLVHGSFIALEPAGVLLQRTILGHATRASMAMAFLDLKCRGNLPHWFREGLASYLAEEGNDHVNFMEQWRLAGKDVLWPPDKTLSYIYPLADRENGRIARYNVFLMLWHLAEGYGFERIQELLGKIEQGALFDEASRAVYGMSERELLNFLDPRHRDEPSRVLVGP
jgi:hypothetical protein